MKPVNVTFLALLLGSAAAWSQGAQNATPAENPGPTPIYRVTVVGRTIKAVNYEHLSEPTKIDFRGTVLAPQAKGEAAVESRKGATKIDAKIEHLPDPTRFGPRFLSYVLWAITPDGRATNLGEVVPDADGNAKLHVTTRFQAFGLLVTAEPYYSVTQPSDVVVLENAVRPDTQGKIEEVRANAQLLPSRGGYTLNAGASQAQPEGKKLSMDRYQAVVALYQAQNAVQIAQAEHADTYAPEVFQKAQQLLQQAQSYESRKASPKQVITSAREAAQAAEDARTITTSKKEEERLVAEKEAALRAAARAKAEAAAAEQQKIMAERESEEQRARAIRAGEPGDQPAAAPVDLRTQLVEQLSNLGPTRWTARGLVVDLSDTAFQWNAAGLQPPALDALAKAVSVLQAHPELKVEVEGYTNGTSDQQLMANRAAGIRDYLVQQGIQAASMTARGLTMRPPADAPQMRHVAIIISGSSLGIS